MAGRNRAKTMDPSTLSRNQSGDVAPRTRAFVRGIQTSRASELRSNMGRASLALDGDDMDTATDTDSARHNGGAPVKSSKRGSCNADGTEGNHGRSTPTSPSDGKPSIEIVSHDPRSRKSSMLAGEDAAGAVRAGSATPRHQYDSTGPIYGRAYEKRLKEKAAAVAADEHRELLTVDEDDLQFLQVPRERRTADAATPGGLLDASIDMFARQSLTFYQDDWHIVKRKHIALSRSDADHPAEATVVDERVGGKHVYEVDIATPGSGGKGGADVGQVDNMPTEPKIFNVAGVQPRVAPTVNGSHANSKGTMSEKRSKKDSRDNTMLPPSKWKRRLMQLRFQTPSGPLVLELYKDEKRQQVTETIDLSDATVEENGALLSIRLVTDETIACNFEMEAQCLTWAFSIREQLTKFAQARTRKATSVTSSIDTQTNAITAEDLTDVRDKILRCGSSNFRDNIRSACSSDLFADYPSNNRLIMPPYDYIDEPKFMSDHTGAKFTVTCEELLFRMNTDSGGSGPHNVEPFFGTLALYDLRTEERISETFHFDLNSALEGFKLNPDADSVTKSRTAVFTVDFPHSDIYLVAMFDKVLQGDIASVADVYTKGVDKPRAAQKQGGIATACINRLGDCRMPFVWAARPVFHPATALNTEMGFSDLFRQEPDRLREDEFLKVLGEYHKHLMASGKFKVQAVPGHFKAHVSPYDSNAPTVSHDLLRVKPFPTDINTTTAPRREILPFAPTGHVVPASFTSYVNYLYIYPTAVNFTAKKATISSKARNVLLRVHVYESDLNPMTSVKEGMRLMFGRSSGAKFVTSTACAVNYHTKTPTFAEEIKIAVPVPVTERHHLFFAFYHVSVDDSSKRSQVETPVGYAWLPLLAHGQGQDDRMHELMVASASATYGDGSILPVGYLQTAGAGMGQAAGPDIKWIDPNKPLFQVNIRRYSSISTRDQHITNFYATCERFQRDRKLEKSVQALHAADPQQIVRFFPVIFNQLLVVLLDSTSVDPADDVSFNIVRVLIHIANLVHLETKTSGQQLLAAYAHHVYAVRASSRSNTDGTQPPTRTVHHELVKYLCECMRDTITKQTIDHFMQHSWFFFKLIFKSMAYYAQQHHKTPREDRFPEDFLEHLETLLLLIGGAIIERSTEDLVLCSSTNVNVALFACECFSTMDRGFVLAVIQKYLSLITKGTSVSSYLIKCKLEFLKILCDYEHFVPLNLPLVPSSLDVAVGPLTIPFVKRHTLVGLVLSSVRGLLSHIDTTLRGMAVSLLRASIAKHEADPRYNDAAKRARIALLYFPVVHMVIEALPRLRESSDPHAVPANGKKSTKVFDLTETRDLLMCFLWVVSNVDATYLHHLWQGPEGTAIIVEFINVLARCVGVFTYRGKSAIEHDAIHGPIDSSDVKRLLSAQYTGGVMSSIDNHRLSSASTVAGRSPGGLAGGLTSRLGSNGRPDSTVSGWRGGGKAPSPDTDGGSEAGSDATTTISETASAPFGQSQRSRTGTNDSLNSTPRAFTNAANKVSNVLRRFRKQTDSAETMPGVDVGALVDREATTSANVALCTLRVMDELLYHFAHVLNADDGRSNSRNPVTWRLLALLNQMLHTGQSSVVIPHLFATVGLVIDLYPAVLFHRGEMYSQQLAIELLHGCNSELLTMREHACVAIFQLMHANLPAMRSSITIAISKVAGQAHGKTDALLRSSLSCISYFVQEGAVVSTATDPGFVAEVSSLIDRLNQVLKDTLEMRHYAGDEEMLVDLHYRVAQTYANTPELRIAWLERIALMHVAQENWSEAAMCVCHCAALICDHLKASLPAPLNKGCQAFATISPNLIREKVVDAADVVRSPLFSEQGIVTMLRKAVTLFKRGQRYELVSRLYMLYFPLLERDRKYADLANISADMKVCFDDILEANKSNKRFLGYFYRVCFYGELWGELNRAVFIYKEPNVTPLSAITERLQILYRKRFGPDRISVIKDSNVVDVYKLDPAMGYIQITFVKPYFGENNTLRPTYFEQNHDIKEFIFETPFTQGGKARGGVDAQCMRKTILTVSGDLSFPYMVKRIRVSGYKEVVMQPLDVAISEMQTKVAALADVTSDKSPNMVMLQMQVQGIVSMQVNAGPMEYASVFLKNPDAYDKEKIVKLQDCFVQMLLLIERALNINGTLIADNQEEYHDDLKTKAAALRKQLKPLLGARYTAATTATLRSRNEVFGLISSSNGSTNTDSVRQSVAFLEGVSSV
eukprot:m.1498353 g.1498353  ORF g.1498353 m.1498353 type:complete len:2221 (+) comp25203_c0_seq1:290-6952(+)